jgi:hypothetical protein
VEVCEERPIAKGEENKNETTERIENKLKLNLFILSIKFNHTLIYLVKSVLIIF